MKMKTCAQVKKPFVSAKFQETALRVSDPRPEPPEVNDIIVLTGLPTANKRISSLVDNKGTV